MLLFLFTYYYFLLFSSQLGRYLWYEIPYPIIASCVQVGKKGKGCYKKGVKFEGLLQYWVWRCMLNPYNYPLRFVFSPRVRKIFANFHHYLRNAIFWHTTNSWGISISLILVKHLICFSYDIGIWNIPAYTWGSTYPLKISQISKRGE